MMKPPWFRLPFISLKLAGFKPEVSSTSLEATRGLFGCAGACLWFLMYCMSMWSMYVLWLFVLFLCFVLSSNRAKWLNLVIFGGLAIKSQVDWTVVRCGIQSGNARSQWPAVYSGHDVSDICLKLSDDMWWLFSNLMCKCQFDMFADLCFQSRTSCQCCDMDSAEIQTKRNFKYCSNCIYCSFRLLCNRHDFADVCLCIEYCWRLKCGRWPFLKRFGSDTIF